MTSPMVPRLADWHAADVVAELRKRGWSLRRLSLANGYGRDSLRLALRKPWPKAEAIIATTIGVHPAAIWPRRYGPDGKPNRQIGGVRTKGIEHIRNSNTNIAAAKVEESDVPGQGDHRSGGERRHEDRRHKERRVA